MIAMRPMLSTSGLASHALPTADGLFAVHLAGGGCVEHLVPPGPAVTAPRETDDTFVMPDGMRLPYRAWLPDGGIPGRWCWHCMA